DGSVQAGNFSPTSCNFSHAELSAPYYALVSPLIAPGVEARRPVDRNAKVVYGKLDVVSVGQASPEFAEHSYLECRTWSIVAKRWNPDRFGFLSSISPKPAERLKRG
ncbi:MAG TPA: hypothetical protein VJX67_07590, partial [Blastocatellia bacterium]|nr:hypothetical protein [Blastocatellia bacterium]